MEEFCDHFIVQEKAGQCSRFPWKDLSFHKTRAGAMEALRLVKHNHRYAYRYRQRIIHRTEMFITTGE